MSMSKSVLVAGIAAAALTGCETAPEGPPDPDTLPVRTLDPYAFIVSGAPSGDASWCALGNHLSRVADMPGDTQIQRVAPIGPDGLVVRGPVSSREIPGPGILYVTETGTVFDFLTSNIQERRSVSEAVSACG